MPALQVLLTVIPLSVLLCVLTIHGQVILEHPSSLMIPVNSTGSFSCVCNGSCQQGKWVINGTHTDIYSEGRSQSEEKGFTFTKPEKCQSTYTYTLTVNASEIINDTVIFCDFEPSGNSLNGSISSMNATLLVISNSPVSPNPSIQNDSTRLSLLWSPPFLWPGQRIDYYNVLLTNKSDGSIKYYKVDSVFSDQVVKLTTMINPNEMCTTTEIQFCILPIGTSGRLLRPRNVTGWITPLLSLCAINGAITDLVTNFKVFEITAFGICLGVITSLLMILIACAIHLCSRHFKRRTYWAGVRSKDPDAKSYNNMVHNPIYAGLSSPVYDSIWPRAETLGEQQMTSSANQCIQTDTKRLQRMNNACAPTFNTACAPN